MNKPVVFLFAYPLGLTILCLLLSLGSCTFNKRNLNIYSPDESIRMTVSSKAGQLFYSVVKEGELIIEDTPLGLYLDSEWLGRRVRLGKQKDTTYTLFTDQGPVATRFASVPILHRKSGLRYVLTLRVSSLGFAYRYELSTRENDLKNYQKLVEKGAWKFPEGSELWYTYHQVEDGVVQTKPVEELQSSEILDLPILVSLGEGKHFARLGSYSEKSVLAPRVLNEGNRELMLRNIQEITPNGLLTTPWKLTYLANDLSSLYKTPFFPGVGPEEEGQTPQPTYVQGGDLLRIPVNTLGPDTVLFDRYQQVAKEWSFEYVSLEEGWEQWSNNWKWVKKLSEKYTNVGVWLWKDLAELEDPNERRLFFRQAQYHQAKGAVLNWDNSRELQNDDAFLQAIFKDAEEFQQMVLLRAQGNYHGFIKSKPNFMGITRQAQSIHEASHSVENVSRSLLAANHIPDGGVQLPQLPAGEDINVKMGYSLANALFSRAHIREWEGSPSDFSFHGEQELLSSIPTYWEEEKILPITSLGNQTAIARRKEGSWYLAIQNGSKSLRESIPFHFLGKGRFKVSLFKDAPGNLERLLHKTMVVDSAHWEEIILPAGGGLLAQLEETTLPLQEIGLSYATEQLAEPVNLKVEKAGRVRTVRYTLDGSDPGRRSAVYKKSLRISRPLICKMAAYKGREKMHASTEVAFVSFPGPDIQAADSIFWDEMEVQIWNESGVGDILYTLNGRAPSRRSYRYKNPILLKKTTTVNASILLASGVQSSVQQKTFVRIEPLKADSLLTPKRGLSYFLFLDEENSLHRTNPEEFPSTKKGIERTNFGKLAGVKDSSFNMIYKGYVKAPIGQIYTLDVRTSGYVQLIMGERVVLEANANEHTNSASGFVGLEEGYHPITIIYTQLEEEPFLELTWGHSSMERQSMKDAFFYESP
ncbi:MAG: glycoside hydrolase family 97 N-terminal domain-containing protein [Bacteroidota bacterium]